jgi:hypothetical protein
LYENFMDMSHQFLHQRWMGRFKHEPLVVHKKSDYIEVDYTFDPNDGGMAGSFQDVARKPRLILKYLLPRLLGSRGASASHAGSRLPFGDDDRPIYESDFMTISTQYPYQTLRLRRPNLIEPMLKLWLTYVPIGREQKISQLCGVMMIRKTRAPWLIFLLQPIYDYFYSVIFEEDRVALEAEQRAYDLQEGDWNQEILPFILDLRELLITQGVPIGLRSSERIEGV